MSIPVTVQAFRARAARLYQRMSAGWATCAEPPEAPLLDLPLHPPNERTALADPAGTVTWVASWRTVPGVVWRTRNWASLGTQQVPERVVLAAPQDVADAADRTAHWRMLTARTATLVEAWGEATRPVLRRHARSLVDLDDLDFARLRAVVQWLVAHPHSGMYLRQLPVEGVSTKWAESHRALLHAAVTTLTGRPDLGLREAPALVRLRFLDPALAPGGLLDLAAAPADLAGLDIRPRRVLVVENLQTLLALEPEDGTIAVHGAGYAVDRVAEVGWLRDIDRVDYWGDLDRDGFAILNRLRAHCPQARSVLMDAATLLEHRHLWVPDPTSGTVRMERLVDAERAVVALLHDHGGVRLEQERLAWPWCLRQLRGEGRRLAGAAGWPR